MNRNNMIDLFRLIGAFFIMSLHTKYGNLDDFTVGLIKLNSRWAVPFFFICSGFFFGKKLTSESFNFGLISHRVIKFISILIIASIIYLPVDFYLGYFHFGVSNLLTGTFIHLWFIGALLFSFLFIWYVYQLRLNRFLGIISITILLFALIADTYDVIILGFDLDYSLFRFLSSIPFVYSGMVFSKKTINPKYIYSTLGVLMLGIILQFIEGLTFLNYFNLNLGKHQLLISTLIVTYALFILSLSIKIPNNLLSEIGRKHSLWIYLYHPLLFVFISGLLKIIAADNYPDIERYNLIFCIFLSTIIAGFLEKKAVKYFKISQGDILNLKRGE